MAILEITNLSYDYITKAGRVHAVKEATASFDTGVVYAIVGRSGSGKSTLMSLMAGLDVPKEGKILYEGVELASIDRDRYRREHVGMIFQSYYLLPQLTAVENVELALELSKYAGNRRERAMEMLSLVGITKEQFRKRSPEFSGGEQQRIAVARAIAADPSVILADEPTGNLDPVTADGIMQLFQKIASQGCAVVMSTHNTALIENYPARAVLFSKGKIREVDLKAELA